MLIKFTDRATPRLDLGAAVQDFKVGEYIADSVLPVVPTEKKAATIPIIAGTNNRASTNRASNGQPLPQIGFEADEYNYNCLKYGLALPVTDEEYDLYKDDFDAESIAASIVRAQMLNGREIRVAGNCFNTTTFTVANGHFIDNKAKPWSTVTTDIISQVAAGSNALRALCGYAPDTLTINYATLQNMLKNTGIKAMFPGAPIITKAMIEAQLAAILGLRKVNVGVGTYNSAAEGQTAVITDIWSSKYALLSKTTEGIMTPGLGWQMSWRGNGKVRVGFSSYYKTEIEATVVQESEYMDELLYDSGRFGYLMQIEA